jgi:hypothetical protein
MTDEKKVKDVEAKLNGKKRRFSVFIEEEWDELIEAYSEKDAENIVDRYLKGGRNHVWVSRVEEVDENDD